MSSFPPRLSDDLCLLWHDSDADSPFKQAPWAMMLDRVAFIARPAWRPTAAASGQREMWGGAVSVVRDLSDGRRCRHTCQASSMRCLPCCRRAKHPADNLHHFSVGHVLERIHDCMRRLPRMILPGLEQSSLPDLPCRDRVVAPRPVLPVMPFDSAPRWGCPWMPDVPGWIASVKHCNPVLRLRRWTSPEARR